MKRLIGVILASCALGEAGCNRSHENVDDPRQKLGHNGTIEPERSVEEAAANGRLLRDAFDEAGVKNVRHLFGSSAGESYACWSERLPEKIIFVDATCLSGGWKVLAWQVAEEAEAARMLESMAPNHQPGWQKVDDAWWGRMDAYRAALR